MNLRQLRYFLAIVDHGGVHRAAEALHVAQSSLSQTMRALERDLGTELFHRIGRGIVLSPAGEGLVGPARSILREVDNAERAVTEIAALRAGTIDIASLSDLAIDPVSTWMANFLMAHPGVQCRVEEGDNVPAVAEMVRTGSCELGFVSTPPVGDLECSELVEQIFVLICPPGSEDRWPNPVPISSLRNEPFVLAQRGTGTREYIEQILREHGVEPRIAVEIRQREAILPLVLSGCAVGIVPLRVAVNFWHRGGVVRELDPAPATKIFAVTRPGKLTGVAEAFLAAARSSLDGWVRALEPAEGVESSLIERASAALDVWDRRAVRRTLDSGDIRTAAEDDR
ncbi:LysR family transcriptional regulator [Arthrobacter sp. 35W]|uniref:LysR family transcriptional regulator n=1 Tax=Arthrobacter sp. 35W TaxID=1132441 RepID=UPI00040D019E|nr:LysR family transcriptional regulator [Arthrobacter sp. 35W]